LRPNVVLRRLRQDRPIVPRPRSRNETGHDTPFIFRPFAGSIQFNQLAPMKTSSTRAVPLVPSARESRRPALSCRLPPTSRHTPRPIKRVRFDIREPPDSFHDNGHSGLGRREEMLDSRTSIVSFVIAAGNPASRRCLGRRAGGISRAHDQWADWRGVLRPPMPSNCMLHHPELSDATGLEARNR